MLEFAYALAPFAGYVIAGSCKFVINCLRQKKLAFKAIGLGGIPSTHNTITATVASLIYFDQGLHSAAFSVALCLLLIVAIDAMGLRRHLEQHAKFIAKQDKKIRQKLGHHPLEVLAGFILGTLIGFALYKL